jgi:hypothetical protein
MTWANDSINLNAARKIFIGVEFQEIKISGEVVGYKALIGDRSVDNRSLTALCQRLWNMRHSITGQMALVMEEEE